MSSNCRLPPFVKLHLRQILSISMLLLLFIQFLLPLNLIEVSLGHNNSSQQSSIIEAEDRSRVMRVGEWRNHWNPFGASNDTVLFTVGQHMERLVLNFVGTAVFVRFYCFRSGIADIYLDGEKVKSVDTFSGDNYETKFVNVSVARDLNYGEHTLEIVATGKRNRASAAEYIYVDAFYIDVNEPPEIFGMWKEGAPWNWPSGPLADLRFRVRKSQSYNYCFIFHDDDNISSYRVNWGDGIIDGEVLECSTDWLFVTLKHAYSKAGEYTATAWAIDTKGKENEVKFTFVVLEPPDLAIDSSDIEFLWVQEKMRIYYTVHNYGDEKALDFNVTIRDKTSNEPIRELRIHQLEGHFKLSLYTEWSNPQLNHIIEVIVDSHREVGEGNEGNNVAERKFIGNEPVITKITPYYSGKALPIGGFTALKSNLYTFNVKFEATVNHPGGINQIKNVTFYVNGVKKSVDTDYPYIYQFDVANELLLGHNTVSAIAYDKNGFSSDEFHYHIRMIEIPSWLLDLGGLTVEFDTGSLSYKIEYSKEFLNNLHKGPDYPVIGGENGVKASISVSVELPADGSSTTISGTGEIVGKLFKREAKGSITLTGTLKGKLHLEEAGINLHLELELFEIPYTVDVPVIGKQGITITGTPHIDIDATFKEIDQTFKLTNLKVGVGGSLEANVEFGSREDLFPVGFKIYAFADGTIFAQYPDTPPLSVEMKFGVGAEGWLGNLEGKTEWSWQWDWPSSQSFNQTEIKWKPFARTGSNATYGENYIFANTQFDDDPCIASSSKGNIMMVYVSNSSTIEQSDIYYVLWDGSSWSKPKPINSNRNYEFAPTVTFDSEGNAMAIWVYNKNSSLTNNSTFNDLMSSLKSLEIYYAFWNKSTRQWTVPKPITNDNEADSMPSIAAGKNRTIIAAWVHDKDSNMTTAADRDIYYSIWNGTSWSSPKAIANIPEADITPSLAIDNQNNAILVWVHDENSTSSIFIDRPPTIQRPRVNPEPATEGEMVTISAEVTDDIGISTVKAFINATYEVELFYNWESGLYEGNFTPLMPGKYTVDLIANDTLNQEDYAQISFNVIPLSGAPPPEPVIREPTIYPDGYYSENEITISANIYSEEPLTDVSAEIFTPSGTVEIVPLIQVDENCFSANYTPHEKGTYFIRIVAINVLGLLDEAGMILISLEPPGDKEIYYSTWNGTGWSQPAAITDNYVDDTDPQVVFDLSGRAVVVWEQCNTKTYQIYFTIGSQSSGWSWRPPEKLSEGQQWAMDPKVAARQNLIITTWRGYPNEWGDLYYRVFNTTYGGYDKGPVQRITDDIYTDWKQSVVLTETNAIIVWLKHCTTIHKNYTTYTILGRTYKRIQDFTINFDDDDPYFAIIPIKPDLVIEGGQINHQPEFAALGEPVIIKATLKNKGDIEVLKPFMVEIYDGNPAENGTLINATQLNMLLAGQNKTIQTQWIPSEWGKHTIYVVVDPLNNVEEASEENNIAYEIVPVQILPGNKTDKIVTDRGNITVRHNDDVSLTISGSEVMLTFSSPGIDDYVSIDGKWIPVMNGTQILTLIPTFPTAGNITISHYSPAFLYVHGSHVEVIYQLPANNEIIKVSNLTWNKEILINHTDLAMVHLTNQTVSLTFNGNGTDSFNITPLNASLTVNHYRLIKMYVEKAVDPSIASLGQPTENSIGKFLNVTVSSSAPEWVYIKVYYNESLLNGINETNLRMFYWDEAAEAWVKFENSGVNVEENYVWANTTHLTIITAMALPALTGDINGDYKVDYKDLFLLAAAYGSTLGEPRYDPNADFNKDSKVNYKDLFILAANYGKKL